LAWAGCAFLVHQVTAASSIATERHVVVIVWDGMRPDFVTPENTPALWKLAKGGVFFRNHHAVFLSATNVNGAAIATGHYPSGNGIFANYVYRPDIDRAKCVDTAIPAFVNKGDEISGGNYLAAPTIAELVRAAGRRVAIAGAKDIALLQDRHLERTQTGTNLFSGKTLPRDALAPIAASLGTFPDPAISHARADLWTTTALTNFLWKGNVPDFSLLWLSEPDASEHLFAPGSKEALAAMKSSDDNLARLLAALDRPAFGNQPSRKATASREATAGQASLRSTTDIFVVSDHGFSTIERSVDLREILQEAGFDAVTEFANEPKAGQIMLGGNGGTVLFYVMEHDARVIGRLVEFLQQSNFAGVIFTKEKLEGTFTLEQGKISSAGAPDVAMAFRWNDSKNRFGVPGMIDADWNRKAGQGTHATLSRFDMHNTLIAAGPDFRRGETDDLPSGNVDLAPTILRIYGITPPQQFDGRILSEAMGKSDRRGDTDSSRGELDNQTPETKTIEAARKFASGTWRQSLHVSRVGSTIYLDEGNGVFVSKK